MKPIHKRRLAKLALALLDAWDADKKRLVRGKRELEFDMGNFLSAKRGSLSPIQSECGTTCCFIGFAPLVFPAMKKPYFWSEVSLWVTGLGTAELGWDFLFEQDWPSDPVQAAKRALWVLSRGIPRNEPDYTCRYYDRMTPATLRSRLLEHANA